MWTPSRNIGWVNSHGDPIEAASTGPTAVLSSVIRKVVHGDALQPIDSLRFRDPHYFRAGELHDHTQEWENSNDLRQFISAFPSTLSQKRQNENS